MKKIITLSAFLLCIAMTNAQNNLYFVPTYTGNAWEQFNDDGAPIQSFNILLVNSTSGDSVYLELTALENFAHVYYCELPSTNFDVIRFYRVPPGELISDPTWGWNKTGNLPFDYSQGDLYTMNESVWEPGDNDIQYFTIGTFNPDARVVIRFRQPSNEWEAIYIYSWGGPGEAFGPWPGATSEKDADGWYEVTVPIGQAVGNAIFNNNNAAQFNADNVTNVTACYELTTTEATEVPCSEEPEPSAIEKTSALQKNIDVYPNPATSTLSIDIKNIKQVTVFDIRGRKMMSANTSVVNVQPLCSGLYFVEIQQTNGTILKSKFIKK
ncbi:MAG: T9SS type A sorting domain-containing protein [Bacteroidales bacterium]|jgi:hypothetical protein|nr:T9SS type A sorting domain-containing protein [Bacteroidales bacterium]